MNQHEWMVAFHSQKRGHKSTWVELDEGGGVRSRFFFKIVIVLSRMVRNGSSEIGFYTRNLVHGHWDRCWGGIHGSGSGRPEMEYESNDESNVVSDDLDRIGGS